MYVCSGHQLSGLVHDSHLSMALQLCTKLSGKWVDFSTDHEVSAADFDDGALLIIPAGTHGLLSCITGLQLRKSIRVDSLRVHRDGL